MSTIAQLRAALAVLGIDSAVAVPRVVSRQANEFRSAIEHRRLLELLHAATSAELGQLQPTHEPVIVEVRRWRAQLGAAAAADNPRTTSALLGAAARSAGVVETLIDLSRRPHDEGADARWRSILADITKTYDLVDGEYAQQAAATTPLPATDQPVATSEGRHRQSDENPGHAAPSASTGPVGAGAERPAETTRWRPRRRWPRQPT
ncbi:hypothetical protein [Nocardia sp. NPDC052566]|uniref:hypothetical protein n=1 Tax=Nocardia sp. NPDC052566 TaxID=3364330 RepID=UPI0037C6E599